MAESPGSHSGLGALLVELLGAAAPAVGSAPVVTAPSALVARLGVATNIGGASVGGFGPAPLRVVIAVSSGVLQLPSTTRDVTVPAGHPPLGTTGPELAIEGAESMVNVALGNLWWLPALKGPAEVTVDVAPAGAAHQPEGRAVATLRAAVPPSAPVITDVEPGAAEATVRWQPPLVDGGAPVLSYVVGGDPSGWYTVPATQTSCVLRGLVSGAAHTFRVVAINEVGLGSWCEPSAPVVPTAPVAPAPTS